MKKIEAYITLNQMSIGELARKLNKPYPSVYCWVKGTSIPSIKSALLIEKLTGGSVTVYDWCK
jgi:hypothetical protein